MARTVEHRQSLDVSACSIVVTCTCGARIMLASADRASGWRAAAEHAWRAHPEAMSKRTLNRASEQTRRAAVR